MDRGTAPEAKMAGSKFAVLSNWVQPRMSNFKRFLNRCSANKALTIAFVFGFSVLVLAVLFANDTAYVAAQDPSAEPTQAAQAKRLYTISKETTYFTGPLKPDGSIDFIAAVNDHFSKRITAESNAARIIVPLLDPLCWSTADQRNMTLIRLGLDPEEFPPEDTLHGTIAGDRELQPTEEEFLRQYVSAIGKTWTDDDFPLVAEWLAENEAKLERIVEGAQRSQYFVPLPTIEEADGFWPVLMDPTDGIRNLVRTFSIRAHYHFSLGQWQKSWDDLLTIKRISEHFARGPMMIDSLTAYGFYGIACGDAVEFISNADQDVDWEKLLQSWEINPVANLKDGFEIGERAYIGFIICEIMQQPDAIGRSFEYSDIGGPAEGEEAFAKLKQLQLQQAFENGEIRLDDALRLSNQYFDQAVAASESNNVSERNAELRKLNSLLGIDAVSPKEPEIDRVLTADSKNRSQVYAKALVAQFTATVPSVIRIENIRRGSQHVVKLALAARVFQKRNGKLPGSLNDLKDLVSGTTLVQPLTGDPIGFKVMEHEIVIYHWSHDGFDDGGDVDSDRPKDWGIRIRE